MRRMNTKSGGHSLFVVLACVAAYASGAVAESIEGRQASLSLMVEGQDIQAKLSSPVMGNFAAGPYVWQAKVDGADLAELKNPQVKQVDKKTLLVTGKLGPLDVEQRFTLLENSTGVSEVISLRNSTGKDVVIDDIRAGFTRKVDPKTDPYRLVAVPYRRQANGTTHDYSMADVAAVTQGKGKINPTCQPAWSPRAPLVDDEHRRLRSESWILTDGKNSLLVLKYNNKAIEHSAVNWIADQNRLVFGGCAYVLHKEPVQANRLKAGTTFSFGETRYEFYQGGWPQGYAIYKAFINTKGHGLTDDYNPQVQWEILFDLGDGFWPRAKVIEQAALAKEIGCTRMYFDPGWQQYGHGTALWDTERLGPVEDMVKLMKETYGLELGLWTASSVVYDHRWPRDYDRKIPGIVNEAPAVREGQRNLALLPTAIAKASSVYFRRKNDPCPAAKLTDGRYGDVDSWIAATMPAWAEIDLGAPYVISKVMLSNDNTQRVQDRAAKAFRIMTATRYNVVTNADSWKCVAEFQQYEASLKNQMSFTFEPVTARWVRVVFDDPATTGVRVDEIEIYEEAMDKAAVSKEAEPKASMQLQAVRDLCKCHKEWQAERISRISKLADAGVKFLMFDFHGWTGPCYATDHGHPAPSSTSDHVDSIYGIARAIRQKHPDVRIEMHDGIWPWGCRYLPSYFRQGLKDGDYDENWAYEFMWNSIGDIRSGRALCLYYYNLAYDIPMYLHFNMVADNDQSLSFWWLASTVRHIGIGGRTHAARMQPHGKLKELTDQEKQARFDQYKKAMVTYNRLKRYFTKGAFVGIDGDETLHLHTLPDRAGGVLLVFNLSDKPISRTVRVPLDKVKLKASMPLPAIAGATGSIEGDHLVLKVVVGAESPALIEIGAFEFPSGLLQSGMNAVEVRVKTTDGSHGMDLVRKE